MNMILVTLLISVNIVSNTSAFFGHYVLTLRYV